MIRPSMKRISMQHPFLRVPTFLWILMVVASGAAAAERLAVGDPVPAFTSQDQHEKPFEFKPGYRHLMITFDMGTAKLANQALTQKGTNYLDRHQAVYVSDIHGMPAIGRFFALPKMRRYRHRIILADSETLLDPFPRREERVTVLELNPQGVIEKIDYWNPKEEAVSQYLKEP